MRTIPRGLRIIRAPAHAITDPLEETDKVVCEKGQLAVATYFTGWIVGTRSTARVAAHDYNTGVRIPYGTISYWFVQLMLHG